MPMLVDDLKRELAVLPAEERAALAEYLMESLEEEAPVDAEWLAEMNRRWAEIETGAVEGQDAFEALAELRAARHEARRSAS